MFIGEYDYDLDMQVKAEEAREEGLAEGQQQQAIETAKKMLIKKYPLSDIKELTGLSLEAVKKLASNNP